MSELAAVMVGLAIGSVIGLAVIIVSDALRRTRIRQAFGAITERQWRELKNLDTSRATSTRSCATIDVSKS